MNKKLIPPIKMYAAFHDVLKEKLIEWITNFSKEMALEHEWKELTKYEIMDIIESYYNAEQYHEVLHYKIVNDFPKSTGIGPSKVEEILGCTKTERKRWEHEGKLPVVSWFDAGTRRNPISVPMYCRLTIENMIPEILDRWRAEHAEYIAMKRRTKEEIVKNKSLFIEIQAIVEGEPMHKIFGPVVAYSEEEIEEYWYKQKGNLPFEWEGKKCSVFLQIFDSKMILKHEVITV
ncbi:MULTISPECIES: hypothetical protein [Bacillus cereus group]|uniref:hypothetical protein n=1 Tax=Bacillus cereus group TaxID=86661 RepID=UPI001298CB5E|nr:MULTISPECIES: hypothetical protein [Bacillus cereus group]MCR6789937.1 hypothetical protein [Bacillus thuringiensis]MCR6825917.1 hypothetical protein [Bacillus thuringiensis]MCR6831769.1 hypothetical protein [Bacillus thuringiensis]MEB9327349.1 hypothetical protein [Bacillus cereus]MEB9914543.1 hypothetical protein [Bacillus cereus]